MIKPQIHSYINYRLFLSDYAKWRSSERSSWSLGVWARMLGLGGASSLSMILGEKRHAGDKLKEALIKYFGFNGAERSYLEKLIKVNKVTDDETLSIILLDHYSKEDEEKDLPQLPRYILAEAKKIPTDLSTPLCELLNLTPEMASELAKSLPDKPNARQIHLESAELFKRSYDHISKEKRRYYTGMLRVKKDRFKELSEFVRAFEKELMSKFDEDQGEELIILQQALFEVSPL